MEGSSSCRWLEAFCRKGKMTCAPDAVHCEGLGRHSSEKTYEVFGYDTNHLLCSLVFAHFVEAKGMDTWENVFAPAADISGFDVPTRTTIFDLDKSIDSAYKRIMQHANLSLEPLCSITPSAQPFSKAGAGSGGIL